PTKLLCLLLVLLGTACPKRQQQIKPLTTQSALEKALTYKKARRFQKAEELFTYVIFNFPGSYQAADAQFYLADCYFESKDYEQAQSEFDFYLKNFPNGRFEEEALFKRALAALYSSPAPDKDQSKTAKAKELLDDFLEEYPESRFRDHAENALREVYYRLAQREFDAARLYFKAGEYKSALIYYQFLKESFPEINWAESERYRFAICLFETGDRESARLIFEELSASAVSSRIRLGVQRYLNRLQ
ncbi:MAG: outer membrane protein assembly factor BamD, partial [bacterium]